MVSRDFACQLAGYGLTTASILYRMPDHRSILQEFIWQEYDHAPRFPELNKFLAFWCAHLDGPLYRVRVAHKALLGPAELQNIRYTYYPAGHMMYIDPASARQLKADLTSFYASAM